MDEKIVEAVARDMHEEQRAMGIEQYGHNPRYLPGAPWDQLPEFMRERIRRIARAAVGAHTAALAEAGFVIVPKPEPKPEETFAEEVARLNREIGQRQVRLQYLVCGDPRVRVTVPIGAAPAFGKPGRTT